jgi:hypothetical protein
VQLKFLDCVTFATAEDLTAQFTLAVLKAEAQFVYVCAAVNSRSMPTWSKDFLLEFIELFRQEECLRKVKSIDYYNRSKTDASYRTLFGKLQSVEPEATRDTVVKNINVSICVAACFRRKVGL